MLNSEDFVLTKCKCESFSSKKTDECRFSKYPDPALCGRADMKPTEDARYILSFTDQDPGDEHNGHF